MKRQSSALLALTSVVSLAACNGGGASSTAVPAGTTQPASVKHATVTPFSIPFVSDRKSQTSGRGKLSLGGIPMSIGLMDAPANLGNGGQINLGITSADADAAGTLYNVASFSTPNVVNVLNYQSTAYLLGTNAVPALAGYTGVRLSIDVASSSVVSNGHTYPIVFGNYNAATGAFQRSSATTQTVELPMPFQPAVNNQLVVDFNAVESINIVGGVAEVSPQIAGAVGNQETAITGTVVNGQSAAAVASAVVAAIDANGNTVATTQTSSSGWYQLHNVAPGSYAIRIYNAFTNAAGATITAQGAGTSQASIAGPSVSVGAGQNVTLSSAISD